MSSRYAVEPRRVEKPWGWELVWAETDDYVGKLLFVRAGQSLSLQYHEVKDESWLVQQGRASLELGEVGGELETVEILHFQAVDGVGAGAAEADDLDGDAAVGEQIGGKRQRELGGGVGHCCEG